MAHETRRAYMGHGLMHRRLIGIRKFSRALCRRNIIFIWGYVANMNGIYSSDRRTANRGSRSTSRGLSRGRFIGLSAAIRGRFEGFSVTHLDILLRVLMAELKRLSEARVDTYREQVRFGLALWRAERIDEGDEGGKREKGRQTRINRSINLSNGRVVQLGQRDVEGLVADVALFYFGNIRSDLNGDVGDRIDGSIR